MDMLSEQLLDAASMLCNVDPRTSRYLTAAAIVRGETVSPAEVAHSMQKLKADGGDMLFTTWIPDNFK